MAKSAFGALAVVPAFVALALVLAFSACTRRALLVPETADASVDFAAPFDLAGDAATCGNTHEHRPVPLTSLATLDASASYRESASLRLLIGYSLRASCDAPANVTITTKNTPSGAVIVSVLTYEWLGTTSCGAPAEATRVITVPNLGVTGGMMLLIEDGGPNASVPALMLTSTGPAPACGSVPAGDPCNSDCDCSEVDYVCLYGTDGVGRCGFPCNDDVDCRPEFIDGAMTPSCQGAPSYICGASSSCRQPDDCGYDETVNACLCTRPQPMGTTPASCSCDAECPSGTLCDGQHCIIPCSSNSSCPDVCGGDGCMSCDDGTCVSLV